MKNVKWLAAAPPRSALLQARVRPLVSTSAAAIASPILSFLSTAYSSTAAPASPTRAGAATAAAAPAVASLKEAAAATAATSHQRTVRLPQGGAAAAAGGASGEPADLLSASAVFDASPAEIVRHAQRLAQSLALARISPRAGAGVASGGWRKRSSNFLTAVQQPENFRADEHQQQQQEAGLQRLLYSSAEGGEGGAAATAAWGDLVFRAHGLLHAFTPCQLVLLLQSLAAAGSSSLSRRCSRTPIQMHSEAERRRQQQQQQLRACLEQQQLEQQRLLLKSHPSSRNKQQPPRPGESMPLAAGSTPDNDVSNDDIANRQISSEHLIRSSRSVVLGGAEKEMGEGRERERGRDGGGGGGVDDDRSRVCRGLGSESRTAVRGSSCSVAGIQWADRSRMSGSLAVGCFSECRTPCGCGGIASRMQVGCCVGLPCSKLQISPPVFSQHLLGNSLDFVEAVTDRLCAADILKRLSIDELASIINSLHMLQHSHPLLLKKLRDPSLSSFSDLPVLLPMPETALPCWDGGSSSGSGSSSSQCSRGDGRNTESGRSSTRTCSTIRACIGGSDRTSSVTRVKGSSGESSSTSSSKTSVCCSGQRSNTLAEGSSIFGRTAAKGAPEEAEKAEISYEYAERDSTAANGGGLQGTSTLRWNDGGRTVFSWSFPPGSSSTTQRKLPGGLERTQSPTGIPLLPAGLLASKVAALLAQLERENSLVENGAFCLPSPTHRCSSSGPSNAAQVQSMHPLRKAAILAEEAAAATTGGGETQVTAAAHRGTREGWETSPPPPGAAARKSETRVQNAADAAAAAAPPATAACATAPASAAAIPSRALSNWMRRDGGKEVERALREALLEEAAATAAAATRGIHSFPGLIRLIRIWHGCCAAGLICPQLVAHVLVGFQKSSHLLGAEELLLIVRAGAMHLTRQPLLYQAALPGCSFLFLLPSRSSLAAGLKNQGVSSPGDKVSVSQKTAGARGDGYSKMSLMADLLGAAKTPRSDSHIEREVIAEKNGLQQGDREIFSCISRPPDDKQETAMDVVVAELVYRSLRPLQDKMVNMDMRHIAMLLEGFALASFSPEPLMSLLLKRHVLPHAASMHSEALMSIVLSLSALEVRYEEIWQVLSYKVSQAVPQYAPVGLALLALSMAKVGCVTSSLLSEVSAHIEEVEASLGPTQCKEVRALLESQGLL